MGSTTPVTLDGRSLTILDVVHVARDDAGVRLDRETMARVAANRTVVEEVVASGVDAYGVTTGVGSQKASRVASADMAAFNHRLITAHATVASGDVLTTRQVKAALLVQLNGFLSGHAGVRPVLVEALHRRLTQGPIPPANRGASVGASDLVPLAQMALPLIGVPHPLAPDLAPTPHLQLAAKEALSLMNSNAVSLGQGALELLQVRKLVRGFDLAWCLSAEGFRSNLSVLHPAVGEAHPQVGQAMASAHMRRLLAKSKLHTKGEARHLQDPLSFRCAPQIHGAAYSVLEWVWQTWEVELNSVADNPAVDLEGRSLVSHGNMDGTLPTLGMDNLRLAIAAVVDASNSRLHKMHWPTFSGLPSGLSTTEGAVGGVQFLNLSHIVAAKAAQVRARARPAILNYHADLADGIEDYAALLPLSVTATEVAVRSAWVIQAVEIAVACWAIHRRGLTSANLGSGLRAVYDAVLEQLPLGREGEQVFDLRPLVDLVRDGELVDLIDDQAPPVPDFEPVRT